MINVVIVIIQPTAYTAMQLSDPFSGVKVGLVLINAVLFWACLDFMTLICLGTTGNHTCSEMAAQLVSKAPCTTQL
jgi:hypothetical protein